MYVFMTFPLILKKHCELRLNSRKLTLTIIWHCHIHFYTFVEPFSKQLYIINFIENRILLANCKLEK